MILAGYDLKAFSLRTSFDCTRGHHIILQEREATSPAQQWSMNYNSDRHGTITLILQSLHEYFGGNKHFYNQIEDLINKMEVMSGTGNKTDYLGLVRSWILEENLLLLLY